LFEESREEKKKKNLDYSGFFFFVQLHFRLRMCCKRFL